MAYTLTLSAEDIKTIHFVGGRYAWSDALLDVISDEPGDIELSESQAWTLSEAFESDTEGGHSMFPMLDPSSELAEKLYQFVNSIV